MTIQLTPALYQIIYAKYTGSPEDFPGFLCDELARIKNIQKSISKVDNNITKLETEHNNAIHELSVQKNNIRKQCLHELTTYYPDASGGNDDWSQCNICCQEFRGRR